MIDPKVIHAMMSELSVLMLTACCLLLSVVSGVNTQPINGSSAAKASKLLHSNMLFFALFPAVRSDSGSIVCWLLLGRRGKDGEEGRAKGEGR